MKNKIKYQESNTLAQRGPLNPRPRREVDTFLVATEYVLQYEANHSSYGHDRVRIYPAFVKGERCWLKVSTWIAAYGYCASGTKEVFVPFDEGVKILIENGVYDFSEPETHINFIGITFSRDSLLDLIDNSLIATTRSIEAFKDTAQHMLFNLYPRATVSIVTNLACGELDFDINVDGVRDHDEVECINNLLWDIYNSMDWIKNKYGAIKCVS